MSIENGRDQERPSGTAVDVNIVIAEYQRIIGELARDLALARAVNAQVAAGEGTLGDVVKARRGAPLPPHADVK